MDIDFALYFYRIQLDIKMDIYSTCPCMHRENPKVNITVCIL